MNDIHSTVIFLTQLLLSLTVYSLIAKWYLTPWLSRQPIRFALILLIAPHTLRHIGLSFLVPSVASAQLPVSFANMAAYGDFVSGLLAILAIVALRQGWGKALLVVGLFNVIGTVDLINALRQAQAIPYLSATWFIPTFFVPLLLVSHAIIFAKLFKLKSAATSLKNPLTN